MSYLAMARRVLKEQTCETENNAKKAKEVSATRCIECGHPIPQADPECWWGLDRVHFACGKAAWRREWKDEVLPAASAAEEAH